MQSIDSIKAYKYGTNKTKIYQAKTKRVNITI